METPKPSFLTIPIAIIIAGALVAGAVFISNRPTNTSTIQNPTGSKTINNTGTITVSPLRDSDHILGSTDADLVFIEFSDTECPYCKRFHETMNTIMQKYGKEEIAAWVYRHYPLTEKHPKAQKQAEALECANELGGNDVFWKYTNALYKMTPSNNGLDDSALPQLARAFGLNEKEFNTCLASGKYTAYVTADREDAMKSGGNGTPHTVVLFKKKISKKTQETIIADIDAAFQKVIPGAILPPDMIQFDASGDKMSFYGEWPQPVLSALIDAVRK